MGAKPTSVSIDVSKKNYILDVMLQTDVHRQLFNRKEIEKCRQKDECTIKDNFLNDYRNCLVIALKEATQHSVYTGMPHYCSMHDELIVSRWSGTYVPIEKLPSQIRLIDDIITHLELEYASCFSESGTNRERAQTKFEDLKATLLKQIKE